MIIYTQGDLLASDAEAIVNTVNCVGVMGRGIALQFKKQFPDNYAYYETACKNNEVIPGKMLVYERHGLIYPRYIINFPTKRHWRGASRIEDIENGLTDLVEVIKAQNISSIAIPPLGCGLGGLDWKIVKTHLESALAPLHDVEILIFEPAGAPAAEKMARNHKIPAMTDGRAALVYLAKRYLDGLLDPFITLIEIHKLMYFLQEAGSPLRLKYVKGHFGPFASNLSHVLNAVEGYLLSGYADGGDRPDKRMKIVPGADSDANAHLKQNPQILQHIGRVAELVDGFETPFGMELLATVHWIAKNEATGLQDVVDCVYRWGEQKKKFSPRQIEIALERLAQNGWISA